MTYWLINIPFLAAAGVVLAAAIATRRAPGAPALLIAAGVMVLMTAILTMRLLDLASSITTRR